jgi:pimeloyl-ACP methyl ester carboxylesterase
MVSPLKTTVLIHGYGFDQRIWSPLEIAFEGHRVIYLSLPGFGGTPVTESYTVSDLALRYWSYLDELKTGPVHLVGHSMGGYVCLEMMSIRPTQVSSLALVHSHVYADSPEKKQSRSESMQNIRSGGLSEFVNKFMPPLVADSIKSEEIIRRLIVRGLLYNENAWYFGLQAIRDRADHSGTLSSAVVPVLMLLGEEDRAVPVDLAYQQAALAERTSFSVYPGTGHLGMYENTRQMISDLVRFYDAFRT